MPIGNKVPSAADGATIPFEQDYAGAGRKLHDHSFVGVDYPLDTVKVRDPQKPKRAQLLASAATLDLEARIEGDNLLVRATIHNQSGHNLPTGFAFARQMWIELVCPRGIARDLRLRRAREVVG